MPVDSPVVAVLVEDLLDHVTHVVARVAPMYAADMTQRADSWALDGGLRRMGAAMGVMAECWPSLGRLIELGVPDVTARRAAAGAVEGAIRDGLEAAFGDARGLVDGWRGVVTGVRGRVLGVVDGC